MSHSALISRLIENYRKQHALYESLLGSMTAGLPQAGAPPDIHKIIAALESRSSLLDQIRQCDEKIRPDKAAWEAVKAEDKSVEAETLRTLLNNIQTVLSQVMTASGQLEAFMNKAVKKAP